MHFDADIANTTLRFQQQQQGTRAATPAARQRHASAAPEKLHSRRVPHGVTGATRADCASGGGDGVQGRRWRRGRVASSVQRVAAAHDSLDGDGSLQHQEWRALYTQSQREHVLGTIPYRWESEAKQASLVAATFDALDVVVLEGALLHDGGVSGAEKARALKEHLSLEATQPLMAALGARGKVALVRETATEWELVIPHCLLAELAFTERVVARFGRHPRMPVTHRWCPCGAGDEGGVGGSKWEDWLEGCESARLREAVPDLDTAWCLQDA
eukprot:scaffold93009_cov60-Phaeocystis_antarctica.AAC.2